MFKSICVVGLGYIGLPTAAMFASKEINVIGVDIDSKIIETINSGKIHIIEKNLESLVSSTVKKGLLIAKEKPQEADAFIIAVPTPFKLDQNQEPKPDISFVKEAAKSVAPFLKKNSLVIIESTSPVGTTEKIYDYFGQLRPDLFDDKNLAEFNLAYCPERVLPGNILEELTTNSRVVGGITNECTKKAKNLYETFVMGDIVLTNSRTAEMVKLTENASRDNQIAFANELSLLCDNYGINVWELIAIANKHPRVNILQPGPGVGGHCIAVDPWFLISGDKENTKLIRKAREVNDRKPFWVLKKIEAELSNLVASGMDLDSIKISFFGLTFKANIDDYRESPSIKIIEKFLETKNKNIYLVEPNLEDSPFESLSLISTDRGVTESDILVFLVDHNEFKNLKIPKNKIVVDTKGVLEDV